MIKEIYELYRDKYGNQAQMIKAIEELAELQFAITKFLNKQGTKESIIEEIADVEIMTEQLKYMFECFGDVEDWKLKKITRSINSES